MVSIKVSLFPPLYASYSNKLNKDCKLKNFLFPASLEAVEFAP